MHRWNAPARTCRRGRHAGRRGTGSAEGECLRQGRASFSRYFHLLEMNLLGITPDPWRVVGYRFSRRGSFGSKNWTTQNRTTGNSGLATDRVRRLIDDFSGGPCPVYQPLKTGDVPLDVVVETNVLAGLCTHAGGQVTVGEKFGKIFSHSLHVSLLDEKSGLTMNDGVRYSRVTSGHNRESRRTRLQDRDRRTLGISIRGNDRMLDEAAGLRKKGQDFTVRYRAEE